MHQSFESKVAIVTGAASGIGLAIAKKLSQYNVRLALFDNNKDLLLKQQHEFPNDIKLYVVDITNEEAVKKAINET
jgi:NADP-dependent 3-hydroxy acid dehydrogenase YdfG